MPPLIMVVEDDPAIRLLLHDILESAGYAVMLCQHGLEALEMISERRPDLVLTDVLMPFLDGIALCVILQNLCQPEAMPIILLSAAKADIVVPDCRYAAFIAKPFYPQQVLDTIARVLEQPISQGPLT